MRAFAALILLCCAACPLAAQDDWKREADERIEKHRKENVHFTVTKNGKPLDGITVNVEMLQNEFLFGSNIFMLDRLQDKKENAEYGEKYAEIFNFATLGFYWASYERKQGEPNYAYSEQVAKWCKEHHIRTKGHPLVWNTSDPQWIKDIPLDELFKIQTARAGQCTERFRGLIDTWDVINEVTDWRRESQRKNSPKLTELAEKFSELELIKASFAAARKGNPNATLLINDYVHDDRYAALLDKLVENGKALFDVIGIQSHMHSGEWDNKHIWETCERFARFGVPLHFTELTVLSTDKRSNRNWKEDWSDAQSNEQGEQLQANDVVRIYTMLFSHPSVAAITWWDFSDKGAWMSAPAGLLRRDMTPKPAYTALKKLIKEDWSTNTAVKTDASGKASFRAFRGEYRFTVVLPDGTKKEIPMSVRKGDNDFAADLQ